ncbi:Rv3235 family protein [Streptomyces termitum]
MPRTVPKPPAPGPTARTAAPPAPHATASVRAAAVEATARRAGGRAAAGPGVPLPRTAAPRPGDGRGGRHAGGHGDRAVVPAQGRGCPGAARRALPAHTAFAERLLAVLSGERPVHSMLGHTVGEAYDQLVRLAPRKPPPRGLGPRPVLRRCAAQPHAGDTVLEVFASLATGARVRALAFRLERGADHRWRCAAVELDGLGRLTAGPDAGAGA